MSDADRRLAADDRRRGRDRPPRRDPGRELPARGALRWERVLTPPPAPPPSDVPPPAEGGGIAAALALRDRYLTLLEDLVAYESPSGDVAGNRRLAERLTSELGARGAAVDREAAPGFGEHLIARFGTGDVAPLLLVGHMDTVHPAGTLARAPFRVDGERVSGPGTYDMKGGLASVLVALDLLAEAALPLGGPAVFLITCDEEVGSPTSRELIERLGRAARAALVFEPCVPGGAAKVRRKGVAGYRVRVTGLAAHAGIEPDRGASAVHELARWTLGALALEDRDVGTRLNVGVVHGGTRSNVVAADATADLDVRFWTREEAERVDAGLRAIRPADERASIALEGGVNRWPLERTAASGALFDRAAILAEGLGFTLEGGGTGGASDGNFTSGVGCPTLDGLGPDGGGAHALDEHVLLADIPRRIALVAGLLRSL